MINWRTLQHAYGSAEDVPALLDRLSPDDGAPVWQELWSRLCHQGTVYSASFAALPALEAAARAWPAEQRVPALALAAAIVAATDVEGPRDRYLRDLEPTIARLRELTLAAVSRPGWSRNDFVYLLQAVRAFEGDPVWGTQLDCVLGGEFPGRCSTCRAELSFVIGEYGFFTAAGEWMDHPETARTRIDPRTGPLPPVGQWLHEQADAAGQVDLAAWVPYLFGSSKCPCCGDPFDVSETIAHTA